MNAKKIHQRLQELRAAETLADMANVPAAHFHPLKQNRKGQFAVSVEEPYRIIFEHATSPTPLEESERRELSKITEIRILEVKDYHG